MFNKANTSARTRARIYVEYLCGTVRLLSKRPSPRHSWLWLCRIWLTTWEKEVLCFISLVSFRQPIHHALSTREHLLSTSFRFKAPQRKRKKIFTCDVTLLVLPRTPLFENRSLLGTDNVRWQISVHIFAPTRSRYLTLSCYWYNL